jgi:hypothetical protein
MGEFLLTRSAARQLGTTQHNLLTAIARNKFEPPAKDESGRYLWTPEDIARARQAMATDRRRRVPA